MKVAVSENVSDRRSGKPWGMGKESTQVEVKKTATKGRKDRIVGQVKSCSEERPQGGKNRTRKGLRTRIFLLRDWCPK